MTTARCHLIASQITPYYHLISRCVRRGFLCGREQSSGQDYEHRRQWVVDRIALLADVFAIDILAYAVMSNHYHLVIKVASDLAGDWDDDEVMSRWQRIFNLPALLDQYQSGLTGASEQICVETSIQVLRERLTSVSWFMKCLNEHISRRANREDGCTGAFWESRFKSFALLDEKALISCMAYVDLNPIRASIAKSPESSDYTSVQARIDDDATVPLAPFADSTQELRHQRAIPFSSLPDYLALVDWTGRITMRPKRGSVDPDLPPILQRLGFDSNQWTSAMRVHANRRLMIGPLQKLQEAATHIGRCWFKGSGDMATAFG